MRDRPGPINGRQVSGSPRALPRPAGSRPGGRGVARQGPMGTTPTGC